VDKMRLKALKEKGNVEILLGARPQRIEGNGDKVTAIVCQMKNNELREIPLDGIFLAIGSTPNTSLFKNVLELDRFGYIALREGQKTSVDGVFAVGDIADPYFHQAVIASGSGATAAIQAQKYLDGVVASKEDVSVVVEAPKAHFEPIEITSYEHFQKELSSSSVPVIVDFYASWCGPCKRITPLIEQGARNLGEKVKILKVNVDHQGAITKEYKIITIPTLIVFDVNKKQLFQRRGTDRVLFFLNQLEKKKEISSLEIGDYIRGLR